MYEPRSAPLLSRRRFVQRMVGHLFWAAALIAVSLVLGTIGYHWLGGMAWVDAFLNAAMLMGGMGQVGDVASSSGKIFAAFYALYAGLVLIGVMTILLAPVLHRVLHSVHLEDAEESMVKRKQ
jgi:hypothetical protein